MGNFELTRHVSRCRGSKVFDGADTQLRFKNNRQQTAFIHGHYEHAEFFALLINTAEIGFVNQIGNGLISQVSPGSEGGNRRQVEFPVIALVGNEKSALIDYQRSGGVCFFQQLFQDGIELLNIFLDELRQGDHVMRTAGWID